MACLRGVPLVALSVSDPVSPVPTPLSPPPPYDEEGGEGQEELSYYELLGIETTANNKQIRDAFMLKARTSHPDRNVKAAEEDRKRCEEEFQMFTEACETLCDPVARACYDLDRKTALTGEISAEEYAKVAKLKQQESEKNQQWLEETFEISKATELNRPDSESSVSGGGLVIISALYGNFDEPNDTTKWIDVTLQVQVMVEESKLILHREGNYCWLEGFYDPCHELEKQLKIRYLFLEEVHECCFEDGDPIFAPLPSHSVSLIKSERQRSKNMMALGAAAVVGSLIVGGVYYYCRGGERTQSKTPQTVVKTTLR